MEKIAPILDEVVRKITTVRRFMPIIYLVSEDREILFDLFRRKDCFEILQKRGDSEFVPCEYDQLLIGQSDIIISGIFPLLSRNRAISRIISAGLKRRETAR